MKMWIKTTILVLVVLVGATPGFSFTSFGTKSMGMGGAFTGVADDVSCVFWNPAGLTQTGYFDLDVSFSGGGENTKNLANLYKIYQAIQEEDYDKARDLVDEISTPFGLEPTFGVAIGFLKRIAISGGLQAEFNVNKFESGTDEAGDYIHIEDVETAIVPLQFSLARKSTKNLVVGVNIKYIQGARHSSDFKIYSDGEVEKIKDEGGRSNAAFSFDIGALYHKEKSRFTLGMMIENVLEPKLNFPELSGDLSSMKLSRKINLGASFKPISMLTLSADLHDLTGSSTFHFGGELNLKLIKLRAGMNDGNITLGVGLNLFLFNLEAAYYEKKENPYVSLTMVKI